MKQLNHRKLKSAKAAALREAQILCAGKPDRVRHQMFVEIWERLLNEEVIKIETVDVGA